MDNMQDVVIVLDEEERIVSVVPSNSIYSTLLNQPISLLIPKEEQPHYTKFRTQLRKDHIVVAFPMKVNVFGESYACYFNGFHDQTSLFITILFHSHTDNDVLKKMMMLNSQQINELRALYKSIHSQDVKAYEEISKLNSELLNSKRIIEKQNAELQGYNKLLKKMATEDALTGCFNRRHFYEFMREQIFPDQNKSQSAIVMIDFNYFKLVNDQFGHDAGDRLLITFVQIAKQVLLGVGEIYRLGGDEFILYFPKKTEEEALNYLSSITDTFAKHSSIVTLAYGISTFDHHLINYDHDLTVLIRKVDELMYENKNQMKVQHRS